MGILSLVSARRAGKDRHVLRTQMTAVLILVTTVVLVWMETTGTAVSALLASQVPTVGSTSMNVSLHPVPLGLLVWMKLMGTVAFVRRVAVVQDARKLQGGLALPVFE